MKPPAVRSEPLQRLANLACLFALSWMIVSPAFGTPGKKPAGETGRFGDHSINESMSLAVADSLRGIGEYPRGFTYPPPGVVVRIWLHDLAGEWSGWIWIGALVVATFAAFSLTFRLLGIVEHPMRFVIGLIAFMTARYYVGYDLRIANCNGMALAVTLAALLAIECRRGRCAGVLLATAIALKLYSVVFIPYWMWRREFRAVAWLIIGLAIWFVAVPTFQWGPTDAAKVTRDWLSEVRATGDPGFSDTFVAYLVSLDRTVGVYFGPGDLAARSAAMAVKAAKLTWIALLFGYFVAALANSTQPTARQRFCDACVLFLAPLPLSPLLQPHHLAVVLPAHLLFATTFVESLQDSRDRPRFARIVSIAVLVGSVLLIELGPAGPLRGLAVHAHLVILILGLGLIRRYSAIIFAVSHVLVVGGPD